MAKKSFKDATKNVDRFFSSKNDTDDTIKTPNTDNTNSTNDTIKTSNTDNTISTNDTVKTSNTDNTISTNNTIKTFNTDNANSTNDTHDTMNTESTDNTLQNSKSKKNIKKNKTISTNINDSNDTYNTYNTYNTVDTDSTFNNINHITLFKFELKMPIKYKEFLLNASWEEKKTITEYINDLIKEDIKESHIVPNPVPIKRSIKPIYRITLKTPYIDYLRDQSFKAKKSVTEYINDLIKAKQEQT